MTDSNDVRIEHKPINSPNRDCEIQTGEQSNETNACYRKCNKEREETVETFFASSCTQSETQF